MPFNSATASIMTSYPLPSSLGALPQLNSPFKGEFTALLSSGSLPISLSRRTPHGRLSLRRCKAGRMKGTGNKTINRWETSLWNLSYNLSAVNLVSPGLLSRVCPIKFLNPGIWRKDRKRKNRILPSVNDRWEEINASRR